MANIKSAAKRARQSQKRREVNLNRHTALKTAIRKVTDALDAGTDKAAADALYKDVQAKLARAKSKGVIHKNTAARKASRLAKKVAQLKGA